MSNKIENKKKAKSINNHKHFYDISQSEIPLVSISSTKLIADMEVERIELAVKGQSVKECLKGIKELKKIAKEK